MNRFFLMMLFLSATIMTHAQFKNDNVLYKTVDPTNLCSELEKNKGYLLLDVRSPGEHNDTSTTARYNLGRLKGAKNIDIGQLDKRLLELKEYKDKPIFVYCSHSQRSRRASKILADSGFTKVFNVNGGMTSIHYRELAYTGIVVKPGKTEKLDNCLYDLFETSNPYSFISLGDLCSKVSPGFNTPPTIIDVRSDSAFRHISRDPKENAYGYFKGTVNIPLAQLSSHVRDLHGRIILTDLNGEEAAKAAILLSKEGFKHVDVLIEGFDRYLLTDEWDRVCFSKNYQSPISYKTLTAADFGTYIKTHKDALVLDIRSKEEATNTHKDYFRNIGHLKNSVNIPAAVLEKDISGLGNDKTRDIIIYTFGNGAESYAVADGLTKEGFTNVKVLVGGIFSVRWTSGNVQGKAWLADLVEHVPQINQ